MNECKPLVAAFRMLSEAGADPLLRDEQGFTAAMWAAYRNPQAGPTLVHFSAQPEPFLIQNPPRYPMTSPHQPLNNL